MKKNILLLLLLMSVQTTFCEFSWEKVVMVGSAISFLRFAPATVRSVKNQGILNGGFSKVTYEDKSFLIPRLIIDGMTIKAMWDGIGRSRVSKTHFALCFIGSMTSFGLNTWNNTDGFSDLPPISALSLEAVDYIFFLGVDALTAAVCAKNLFSALR